MMNFDACEHGSEEGERKLKESLPVTDSTPFVDILNFTETRKLVTRSINKPNYPVFLPRSHIIPRRFSFI